MNAQANGSYLQKLADLWRRGMVVAARVTRLRSVGQALRFWRRPRQHDLSRQLLALNQTMADCYGGTETEFVGLARALQHLFGTAKELADLVGTRLGSVRKVLDEVHITGADGLAAGTLHDLQAGLAEAADELNTLKGVGHDLRRLRVQVENIDRVGVSVRASVFGFAVESARTADCQHTFGSFISELRNLGDRITAVAEAIATHAAATRQSQDHEWTALSAHHAQLCQLVEQSRTTSEVAAAEAQRVLDRVLGGLQEAETHMTQVMHHAGEAVYYLQFGDIVRQKTEHVTAALSEAAEELDQAVTRRDFAAKAAAADHVIAIQIRQLELVQTEVAAARRQLAESFEALATAAGQLHEALGRWQEHPTSSGSGCIDAFKAELARLEQLHRQGHDLRLGARRSKQNAITASQELVGHVKQVRTLNADIHLLALNAIVKTAALGNQGATLSVLSAHVDSLYCESSGIVGDVTTILDSVLQQTRAAADDSDLSAEATRESRLHAGTEHIESACNACHTAFASATALVGKQQAALESSRGCLDFLTRHAAVIGGQIAELQAFRQTLSPWAGAAAVPAAATLEGLHGRYTMQSERDIHARREPEEFPVIPAATDNLELFEPSGPEPAQMRSGLAPEPAASAPAGTKLGDNVELF
ncbi:MAG TPA: hypothetical protein VL527_18785 [Dongiaceae bacterium]|nr:hypothetical protein [Dongiaceae bacterium]